MWAVFLFLCKSCYCGQQASCWPRYYLLVWTLLCSKSLTASPILHSNNNILESPGDKTKPGPLSDIVILLMIHLKTKVESSCVSRSQCGLSESCHRRVIRVLTCDQVSCVPCTLLSRLYLISCVLYLRCLHQASGRAGGSMSTMNTIVLQMHTSESQED